MQQEPRSTPSSTPTPEPGDPFGSLEFTALDDLEPDQRWSTWLAVQPLCRGPEPRPDWVVTSQAAVDTELGVLKTGKEAEAHLVHRGVPGSEALGESTMLVAKRYRGAEHRDFHRSAVYTDGRRQRRSRDARALDRKSAYGRSVAAGQWAWAEWEALGRLWSLGVPVPYPVQVDGTEILMEWISVPDAAGGPVTAPRLAQTRPDRALLAGWWDQLVEAMGAMARAGLVHGDLSPYNTLAAGERLVIIDLPQIVDLVANPHGVELLQRDCLNMARWFTSRGLAVDGEALLGELLAQAW